MPTTVTGRVVYNRKTHFFTWCDAKRVVRSVNEDPASIEELACFLDAWNMLLELAEPVYQKLNGFEDETTKAFSELRAAQGRFPGFGGGEAGGAGASGSFGIELGLPLKI